MRKARAGLLCLSPHSPHFFFFKQQRDNFFFLFLVYNGVGFECAAGVLCQGARLMLQRREWKEVVDESQFALSVVCIDVSKGGP